MLILGIDPGTCVTGYGIIVFENGKMTPIDYGCIKPPKDLPLEEKYLIIHEATLELIIKHSPCWVAIENQFFYKNAQTALKLGMAKGACLLAATKQKIPICEYPPKQVKLAIAGHGSASKETMQKRIQLLLSLKTPPTPHDAADALSLALCHAHHLKTKQNISRRV